MAVKHRQLDIFQCAGARQQVEALKHEAKFLVPQLGQLLAVKPGHGDAIEQIVSAGGLVEAAERVHQGGFARAARAHDGHEVAALDVQRDAAHGFHLDFAGLGTSWRGRGAG